MCSKESVTEFYNVRPIVSVSSDDAKNFYIDVIELFTIRH